MEYLPSDILKLILIQLNWKDTNNLLKVNKRLYSLDNQNLWLEKMRLDFPDQFVYPTVFEHHKINYLHMQQHKADEEEDVYAINYSKIKSNYLLKYHKDKFRLIELNCDNDSDKGLEKLKNMKLKQYDLILITDKSKTNYIRYVFFMPDDSFDNIKISYQIDYFRGYEIKTKTYLSAPDFTCLFKYYNIGLVAINDLYLNQSKYKFEYDIFIFRFENEKFNKKYYDTIYLG